MFSFTFKLEGWNHAKQLGKSNAMLRAPRTFIALLMCFTSSPISTIWMQFLGYGQLPSNTSLHPNLCSSSNQESVLQFQLCSVTS